MVSVTVVTTTSSPTLGEKGAGGVIGWLVAVAAGACAVAVGWALGAVTGVGRGIGAGGGGTALRDDFGAGVAGVAGGGAGVRRC